MPEKPVTPVSSPEVMSETRDDLLQVEFSTLCSNSADTGTLFLTPSRFFPSQGIRAMDDSIQTLKDEMNKLMSVYEYVKVVIVYAFD